MHGLAWRRLPPGSQVSDEAFDPRVRLYKRQDILDLDDESLGLLDAVQLPEGSGKEEGSEGGRGKGPGKAKPSSGGGAAAARGPALPAVLPYWRPAAVTGGSLYRRQGKADAALAGAGQEPGPASAAAGSPGQAKAQPAAARGPGAGPQPHSVEAAAAAYHASFDPLQPLMPGKSNVRLRQLLRVEVPQAAPTAAHQHHHHHSRGGSGGGSSSAAVPTQLQPRGVTFLAPQLATATTGPPPAAAAAAALPAGPRHRRAPSAPPVSSMSPLGAPPRQQQQPPQQPRKPLEQTAIRIVNAAHYAVLFTAVDLKTKADLLDRMAGLTVQVRSGAQRAALRVPSCSGQGCLHGLVCAGTQCRPPGPHGGPCDPGWLSSRGAGGICP